MKKPVTLSVASLDRMMAAVKEAGVRMMVGQVLRFWPEYVEAKRLLKFLDYFLGVDSSFIPDNSLVREFIGGGCFRV